MVDPGTGLVTLAVLLGGKDVIVKLLGPSAEYLGEEGQKYVEKRVENLKRIFSKSEKMLGSTLEKEGGVSPRILKEIINEGSYCEDEVTSQYYAGMLASSRSEDSKDDRAIPMLALIKSLSGYQIRAHYVIYQTLRQLFIGTELNIRLRKDLIKFSFYMSSKEFFKSLDPSSKDEMGAICTHVIVGLSEKGLIGDDYSMGSKEFLKKSTRKEISGEGLILSPTLLGTQFFLYANGLPNEDENRIIDKELNIDMHKEIVIPTKSVPLR